MHPKVNQTLNLQAVDPIGDEDVWAIEEDGCNSCCHGEVWRQNAEAKMKVLRLQPIWIQQKSNNFHWRWNKHDKREAENLNGHTTARV